jgi:hypothetical protein
MMPGNIGHHRTTAKLADIGMIANPLVAMICSQQFHLTWFLADSSLEVGFGPLMHMTTASGRITRFSEK